MKLRKLYESAVTNGIEADPRGKKTVLKVLEKKKKKYEAMKEDEK